MHLIAVETEVGFMTCCVEPASRHDIGQRHFHGIRRAARVLRQVLKLEHAQVGNGHEVVDGAKTSGYGLDLLEQADHCIYIGVACPSGKSA